MTEPRDLLAMRLQYTTDKVWNGSSTVKFTIDFMLLRSASDNDDFSRHGTPGWSHEHDQKYGQLILKRSTETGDTAVMGDLVYANLCNCNVYQMENKFKTIQSIEKKLEKIQDKQGYPVDLADHAGRLATVMKIDVLLLSNTDARRAQTGYRWDSIKMDGHAINRMRSTIINALAPVVTPSEELVIA